MDETTKEILYILERDAKTSRKEIATMLNISEEKVEKTIYNLEKEGIIRRYKAVVDWERIGEEKVYALIDVKVTPARGTGYDHPAERIANFSEVRTIYLVSGEYDLTVLVEGKTMRDVAFFVAEKLAPLEQVGGTFTHFLLKKYKEDGDIIFEKEDNKRLVVTP